MNIKIDLLMFIFESFSLRFNINDYDKIKKHMGYEKYNFLEKFYTKFEYIFDDDFLLLNTSDSLKIDNLELEILLYLYYFNLDDLKENKTFKDIENDFVIKQLLE